MKRWQLQQICLLMFFHTVIISVEAEEEPSALFENEVAVDLGNGTLVLPETMPTWWTVLRGILYIGQSLAVLCSFTFLLAILSNPAARSVSYNTYLVLLVFLDLLLNFSLMIISILTSGKDVTDASWTQAIIWFVVFYYTANFWLNFIMAHQMFSLVTKSYQRIKFDPPSISSVWSQGAFTYFGACMIATLCSLQVPWSPMTASDEVVGKILMQSPEGGVFSETGGTAFIVVVLFVPTLYVLYVAFTMWWKKLLPKSGRTRVISLFFFRILLVFFAFYYPYIIIGVAKSNVTEPNIWFLFDFLNTSLEILQALTTVYIASKKPDIRKAVDELLRKIARAFQNFCCCCWTEDGRCDNDLDDDSECSRKQGSVLNEELEEEATFGLDSDQFRETKKVNQQARVCKWEEEDVYDYPRKQESKLGEELENDIWNALEALDNNGQEDGRANDENSPDSQDESLFCTLAAAESGDKYEEDPDSKDESLCITRADAESVVKYEEDPQFQELNNGLKLLDLETEGIMEYIRDME